MWGTLLCLLAAFALPVIARADSDSLFDKFKAQYDSLERTVLDRAGEIATIDSFTYQKDVAEIRFGHGTMLFQRPVNGRPTVAVFVGSGHIHIDIPVATERAALQMLARDTVVDDSFRVCFMRLGDDFDLSIRKQYTFSPGQMAVSDFGKVRDAQLEYYFKPTLVHLRDNLVQLLISQFERKDDGYFWFSYDHTVFRFDPNSSEQVGVYHEREPNFALNAAGPQFQRRESARYGRDSLSVIEFPTHLERSLSAFWFGGADGFRVDTASIDLTLLVRVDSLRFMPLYLDPHFDPDSILCNGRRVDFFRRRDFLHMIVLLPAYARRGERLQLSLRYHNGGDQYSSLMPWVHQITPPEQTIRITYPRGYHYLIPERSRSEQVGKDLERCEAGPFRTWSIPIWSYPTGCDSSLVQVDTNLTLVFIHRKYKPPVPQDEYEGEVTRACRWFYGRYGIPSNQRHWYVGGGSRPAIGMLGVPYARGEAKLGGFCAVVGRAVAGAWCSPAAQDASYREAWLIPSLSQYLGMLYTQHATGSNIMYNELSTRKDIIESYVEAKEDLPLAVGSRGRSSDLVNKGVWLFHMLRVLMFDTEHLSDTAFDAFLKDCLQTINDHPITNFEFEKLAAGHFGTRLDWFFDHWLYGRNVPQFDGTYAIESSADQYWVSLHVKTTKVPPDDIYPILIRVMTSQGSALVRKAISGSEEEYRIGPFGERPTDIVFNEYQSVLCKCEVKRR